MKLKCDYCGNYLSDTEERCPNCQAPNNHLKRVGNEVPTTIQELKDWYINHNLPPEEVTRFFIGKNITEPKAFGIYLEDGTGNYVVYKNKDTGERAIRYEGKDEQYAVNELYLKLKEEIQNQKHNSINNRNNTDSDIKFNKSRRIIRIIVSIIAIAIFLGSQKLNDAFFYITYKMNYYDYGYYVYNSSPYYLYNGCPKKNVSNCEWYRYNATEDSWYLDTKLNNLKNAKYIGYDWEPNNPKCLNININKSYEDETWFKEKHPPYISSGYYQYDNKYYYYFLNNWYLYNETDNTWSQTEAPSHEVELSPDDYYQSSATYNDDYNFEKTDVYEDYYERTHNSSSSWESSNYSNDSWDSSSSWSSSDTWDSSSSDWSSDW